MRRLSYTHILRTGRAGRSEKLTARLSRRSRALRKFPTTRMGSPNASRYTISPGKECQQIAHAARVVYSRTILPTEIIVSYPWVLLRDLEDVSENRQAPRPRRKGKSPRVSSSFCYDVLGDPYNAKPKRRTNGPVACHHQRYWTEVCLRAQSEVRRRCELR